jgi:hypothetical protein
MAVREDPASNAALHVPIQSFADLLPCLAHEVPPGRRDLLGITGPTSIAGI